MYDVRPAGVDAGVRLLISDIIVDEFFGLQKVGDVSSIFVQGLALLHVDPFQLLIGLKSVAIEMLVFAPVSGKPYPVSVIYAVFVEYDAVVLVPYLP